MSRNLVILLADRPYAVGLVGLLESMARYDQDADYDIGLWWNTVPTHQRLHRFIPYTGCSHVLSETVSNEGFLSQLQTAYPRLVIRHMADLDLQHPDHVFYLKAAAVKDAMSMDYDSFLYLDCDCLLNAPTTDVWSIIQSGFFVLSPDPDQERLRNRKLVWEQFLGEQITDRVYACAGAFGFTRAHEHVIHRWEDVTARMIAYMDNNPESRNDSKVSKNFGGTDQDALNALTCAKSFGPASLRFVAPRHLIDFHRDFYDPAEDRPVLLPDPLRIERCTSKGTPLFRPVIIHCFIKWWKNRCFVPVRGLGLSCLMASPLFPCVKRMGPGEVFYGREGVLPAGKVGPQPRLGGDNREERSQEKLDNCIQPCGAPSRDANRPLRFPAGVYPAVKLGGAK